MLTISELEKKSNWVRNQVLDMIINANKGHIGGAYSCCDILVSIYYSGIFKFDSNNPKNPERDRFILSKGHSCVALYAILADLCFFPISELNSFCKNDSRLGGHPDRNVPGIEISSGSLGHGLSIACGMSLASKLDNKNFKTIVLLGDCEMHEGSVWEAILFAGHHKLNNLIAIVDFNHQCVTDFIEDSIDLEPFVDKWRAFNWDVRVVDGHSFDELINVFQDIKDNDIKDNQERQENVPIVIIAKTIKGKGTTIMERKLEYHHKIPTEDDAKIIKRELIMN